MSWLEITLRTTRDEAQALENLLWEAGAVSVTMTDAQDEPLLEPGVGETPLWRELVLTGLFSGETDPGELQATLRESWGQELPPPLQCSVLPEQDWVRSWLDDFRPMRFGERLWVCPSWWQRRDDGDEWHPAREDADAWEDKHRDLLAAMQAPGSVVMQLDPGLAFGTGTHPTTALCLQWLDGRDIGGTHLIDFGCGSGILGIAALLLGADRVIGVDNDPQALVATAENCVKNAVAPGNFPVLLPEDFRQLRAGRDSAAVDGVMANILAGTLIELAPQLAELVRPLGWILLSGILREQGAAVIDAFTPWFDDFEQAQDGDWIRISATRLPL